MIPDETLQRSEPASYRTTTTTLIVISIYTAVAAGVLWWVDGLPTAARIAIGLPVLLFTPGYAAVTALFPAVGGSTAETDADRDGLPIARTRTGLSRLERATLAVVASIAIVPAVALATAVVVGVVLGPILAGVVGVTLAAAAVGIVRSPGGTLEGQDAPGRRVRWGEVLSDPVTLVAVGLVVVLLVASAAVAFVGGPADSPRTEFYLADDPGSAGSAAGGTTAGEGQPAAFDLRIEHHGDERQRYTVVVMLAPDDGTGDPVELDRLSTVARPDDPAAETYRLAPSELDEDDTVLFLLYRGDAPDDPDPSSAHRRLKWSADATTGQSERLHAPP